MDQGTMDRIQRELDEEVRRRWALARIRERPAYGRLRERAREIERLKTEF